MNWLLITDYWWRMTDHWRRLQTLRHRILYRKLSFLMVNYFMIFFLSIDFSDCLESSKFFIENIFLVEKKSRWKIVSDSKNDTSPKPYTYRTFLIFFLPPFYFPFSSYFPLIKNGTYLGLTWDLLGRYLWLLYKEDFWDVVI